ncbi:hypothetical protein FRC08_005529 [Ceratobasidium sp. 394]|nr:hypothetical protein FRC08_005529 [Ceratobasidium sp. 394]
MTIPIPEQVPSTDRTAFLPPWTSSPFKVKSRRTGGLLENEMSFGGEGRVGGMENEMLPPIAVSSPDPKRAPKHAPLASVPRPNMDMCPGVNSQVGH